MERSPRESEKSPVTGFTMVLYLKSPESVATHLPNRLPTAWLAAAQGSLGLPAPGSSARVSAPPIGAVATRVGASRIQAGLRSDAVGAGWALAPSGVNASAETASTKAAATR